MGYKIEYECDQTFVDPTTGEIGIRSGERRPEGHEDIGPTWKPVIVKVEDEKKEKDEKSELPQSQRQVTPDHPHAASTQQQQSSSSAPQSPKTAK